MKKLNFKKISVVALNESQISMIKGGQTDETDPATDDMLAKTRKVACCSCCKGTKCNTKKSSATDDLAV